MTDKQKYAIKLAINTMGIHFDRHCNTAYVNRKTGISVGYGEAIDILSDMLSNSDNHACKCQHNNNPRDNETCCRCDDKQTNADRIRNMCDFEEMQQNEKQIRKTSVRTKEIVYRFSVLSDRDKDRIISKFRSIKYSKEQNIEILLDQLAQNRLEEEFLNTIKSYGEDIMAMALEKQIPKKPTPIDYEKYIDVINNARSLRGAYWCPNCKHVVKSGSFCSDCGQKLDWSNEE